MDALKKEAKVRQKEFHRKIKEVEDKFETSNSFG
jgi:hypothetical protein